MRGTLNLGRKGVKAVAMIAIGASAALAIAASPASAQPLSMTFTEARANVGVQLSDAALFQAPDTAPFVAKLDSGGAITDGEIQVPEYSTHIDTPINADVTFDFTIGTITGSYDSSTGALSLSGTAGGTLSATGKQCTVATVPSTLTLTSSGSSGGSSPRYGTPFSSGLAGAGSIAGTWTDMTATAVDSGDADDVSFCSNVQNQIDGAGGVWLDQAGRGSGPGNGSGPNGNGNGNGNHPPGQAGNSKRKCSRHKKLKRGRCVKRKGQKQH